MTKLKDLLDPEQIDTLYNLKRRMQRSARRVTEQVHNATPKPPATSTR